MIRRPDRPGRANGRPAGTEAPGDAHGDLRASQVDLGGLLRDDGSVIVPAEVARDVLRLLVLGLNARVRADGGQLSPLAYRLLHALHEAAERPAIATATDPQPPLRTVAEAADTMGCSTSYVRRLARQGRLPGRRSGRVWLVEVPQAEPEPG